MLSVKVPDNLSHFSRHDLAYFEARSSILAVIPQLGSRSKSRSAKIFELDSNLNTTISNVTISEEFKNLVIRIYDQGRVEELSYEAGKKLLVKF